MLKEQIKEFKDYCADGELFEFIISQIIQAYVGEGQTVVDGGAHYGRHTFPLCAKVGVTGRCYAVEPIGWLADTLKNNSPGPQLQVIKGALMDRPGMVTFYHCTNDEGLSATQRHNYPTEPTLDIYEVAAHTLDEIVPADKTVRLIKLDIEGGEFAALRGARRILENDRPLVIFEHGALKSAQRYGYDIADYRAFWDSLGYHVVDLFGRGRQGERFRDASVWYLVAGAGDEALAFLDNLHIPVTRAAQKLAKTKLL
jgi:FkbM family methyltransferase